MIICNTILYTKLKIFFRFSTLPAVVSDKLQPVVITIERPSFANISMSVLGATNYMEIFWFFFVPYTTYEYKYVNINSSDWI